MKDVLGQLTWPISDMGQAIEALGRESGLQAHTAEAPPPPEGLAQASGAQLGHWVELTAGWLGFEAEPVQVPYPEVAKLVRRAGPALLHLPGGENPRFLAILGSGRRKVPVLGPDLRRRRLSVETMRAALCSDIESPLVIEIDRLLDKAGVPDRRRAQARKAILRERLGATRISGGWLLRPLPGAHFWHQVRFAGLTPYFFYFTGAHAVQYVFWLLSWWIIGRGALQGYFDYGWFLAWILLLLTLIPLRLLVTWAQGRLSLGVGGLLKQRLLYGALRLSPEEVRHQGVGQFLGQVIESEAVESLALSGGFLGLLAVIELVLAALVLGAGAGGRLHVFLLLGWVILTGLLGWWHFRNRQRWTAARLSMTHDLVERMVGHRTRLAQETPGRWHEGEDLALARYLALSGTMDRSAVLLMNLVPRGWLVLGVLGLAPAFIAARSSAAMLAVGLGGVLLALQAFKRLETGLRHLIGAAVAWGQIAPLFHAAARPQPKGVPDLALSSALNVNDREPIIDAHDLVFRYAGYGDPVLRGCSLRLCAGERLLLEGPSGGGKSTLASLLTGLRIPESGLLLLRGWDQQTLGVDGWRQCVVSAPQFHENHVLTETFAFNLLMGGAWPPPPEKLEEARMVCQELGLGELLERMPAGLLQMVGETGWQLSHGERSRLYIARALLQEADLIVLDESFAALDPENLQRALHCVLNRAGTLIVIAHP